MNRTNESAECTVKIMRGDRQTNELVQNHHRFLQKCVVLFSNHSNWQIPESRMRRNGLETLISFWNAQVAHSWSCQDSGHQPPNERRWKRALHFRLRACTWRAEGFDDARGAWVSRRKSRLRGEAGVLARDEVVWADVREITGSLAVPGSLAWRSGEGPES